MPEEPLPASEPAAVSEEEPAPAAATYNTWQDVAQAIDDGSLTDPSFKPSGDGTAGNPYRIATREAFAWFAYQVNHNSLEPSNQHAVLENDIDLYGTGYASSGHLPWVPIGGGDGTSGDANAVTAFMGTFDGQGHAVKNLRVKHRGFFNGLFGVAKNATIKRVVIGSGLVEGIDRVGAILGNAAGTVVVEDCTNLATVTSSVPGTSGTSCNAGGIVGTDYGMDYDVGDSLTVRRCYNAGAVSADRDASGVVGSSVNAIIRDCRNTGYIEQRWDASTGWGVGGICYNGENVQNCYNSGGIASAALRGYGVSREVAINCYYLQGTGTGGGTWLTAEQLKTRELAIRLNGSRAFTSEAVWQGADGAFPMIGTMKAERWPEIGLAVELGMKGPDGTPFKPSGDGSASAPYVVSTPEALAWVVYRVNSSTGNVSASVRLAADIDLTGAAYGGASGSELPWTPFGTYFVPYRWSFDGGGYEVKGMRVNGPDDWQGFFGKIDGATVQNLGLSGSVAGNNYVGGLAGVISGGTVQDCSVAVEVMGVKYVGGLVGEANMYEVSLTRSSHVGKVTGTNLADRTEVGGLVGTVWGNATGRCDVTVSDCYHRGDVTAAGDQGSAGGLFGRNTSGLGGAQVSISNSYASGALDAVSKFGIAARAPAEDSLVGMTNCYYDANAAPDLPYQEGVTPLAATDMKDAAGAAFAAKLNGVRETGAASPWRADVASANGGFPVFKRAGDGIYAEWGDVGRAIETGALEGNGFKPTGDGTVDSPYEVSTPEALAWLSYQVGTGAANLAMCIRLAADIDLTGGPYGGSSGRELLWTPLGTSEKPFNGAFDGAGHKIKGLLVVSVADNQGFVGKAQGSTVKNLSLSGRVTGNNYVGGLAGVMTSGAVEDCSVAVEVMGVKYVGGLVGEANSGTVSLTRSSHVGKVTATNLSDRTEAGGLVGTAWGGSAGTSRLTVSDCYHRGDVTAAGDQGSAGGLFGRNTSGLSGAQVSILNSYASGALDAVSKFGVAARAPSSDSSIDMVNCYYDASAAPGLAAQAGVTPLAGSDMKDAASAAFALKLNGARELGIDGPWRGGSSMENDGFPVYKRVGDGVYLAWGDVGRAVEAGALEGNGFKPTGDGTADSPYEVSTPEALAWVSYRMGTGTVDAAAHIKLMGDIDLMGGDYGGAFEKELPWTPLGTATRPFRGVLDGAGHTIGGLRIDTSLDRQGLVGAAAGATLRDLHVKGSVAGGNYVGALVGRMEGGSVVGCSVEADVSGGNYVGGLMGESNVGETFMTRSKHVGAVEATADGSEAGGLVGVAFGDLCQLTVSDCYHRGSVTAKGSAGGLFGRNADSLGNAKVSFGNSYASGAVEASSKHGVAAARTTGTGTVSLVNCYYDSTAAPDLGSHDGVTALSESDMKKTGEADLAFKLNGSRSAGIDGPWRADVATLNGGYPVFTREAEGVYLSWGDVGRAVEEGVLVGDGFKPIGAGTDGDPYSVSTPEALAWLSYQVGTGAISSAACIRLAADIDLTGSGYIGSYGSFLPWSPLGTSLRPFMGVLEGAGFQIAGLYVKAGNGPDYQGLVGKGARATLRDVRVSSGAVGSSLTHGSYVGGLAGYLEGGTVEECSVKVDGVVGGDHVGGLVGTAGLFPVTITRSSHRGPVTANSTSGDAGGLVGTVWGGSLAVSDCYSNGDVNAAGGSAGGLLGHDAKGSNEAKVSIKDSYAAGRLSAASSYGVLTSVSHQSDFTAENCYFVQPQGAGYLHPAGVAPLSSEEMRAADVPDKLNGSRYEGVNGPWRAGVAENDGYPELMKVNGGFADWGQVGRAVYGGTLTGQDFVPKGNGTAVSPFMVKTPVALAWFAHAVNSGRLDATHQNVQLAADIDLKGETLKWVPLGTNDRPFKGVFEGGGHVVMNMEVGGIASVASNNNQGFIGVANEATLREVRVQGSAAGYVYVGGLAGMMNSGTIEGCSVEVDVQCSGNYAGGLVGKIEPSVIVKDCTAKGAVSGPSYVGGLVGEMLGGSIEGCSAGTNETNNRMDVFCASVAGGLVGRMYPGASLTRSSHVGEVRGSSSQVSSVGGLACVPFKNSSSPITVSDCFHRGNVTADAKQKATSSGLINWINANVPGTTQVTLTNCYVQGAVTGSVTYGVVNTASDGGTVTMANCFYEADAYSDADADKGVIAYTAEQMKSRQLPVRLNGARSFGADAVWTYKWNNYPEFGVSKTDVWPDVGLAIDLGMKGPNGENLVPEGDGSPGSPYLIGTAEALAWFAYKVNSAAADDPMRAAHARLTADIDLGGATAGLYGSGETMNWTEGIGTGTGSYTGMFDGAGFLVGNMKVTVTGGWNRSLFSSVDGATVRDLHVQGQASGSMCVAGLIGVATGGAVVTDCLVEVDVQQDSGASLAGGVVAEVGDGGATLRRVGHKGTVAGSTEAGGLVGTLTGTGALNVEDCFHMGTVSTNGSGEYKVSSGMYAAGGIFGRCFQPLASGASVAISNSYSVGAVVDQTSDHYHRYGVANVGVQGVTLKNCYYNSDLAPSLAIQDGATPYDTDTMTAENGATLAGQLNGTRAGVAPWGADTGGNEGYPVLKEVPDMVTSWADVGLLVDQGSLSHRPAGSGTADDPCLIGTPEALAWFGYKVNSAPTDDPMRASHVRLTADIDLTGSPYLADGAPALKWVPIGESRNLNFKGSLDGFGKSITGLYVDEDAINAGFFGFAIDIAVKNLRLQGSVRGQSTVGGLVGTAVNSNIEDCMIEVDVEGCPQGGNIGGVAGAFGQIEETDKGSIVRTSHVGSVVAVDSAARPYAGGLVGGASSQIEVRDCYHRGAVENKGSSAAATVSGLVGVFHGQSAFVNSYAAGEVTGSRRFALASYERTATPSFVNCCYDSTLSPNVTAQDSVTAYDTSTMTAENGATLATALNAERADAEAPWRADSGGNASYPELKKPNEKVYATWADVGAAVDAGTLVDGNSASFKPTGEGTQDKPYRIGTPEAFAWFAYQVNNSKLDVGKHHAQLVADIDLSGTSVLGQGTPLLPWMPIGGGDGTATNPKDLPAFQGTFDGQGHEVRNLTVVSRGFYSALFGLVRSATVRDVHVASGYVAGVDRVAGVVADAVGTTLVEDCSNAADVWADPSVAPGQGSQVACNVGGVVGTDWYDIDVASALTVRRCSNSGSVRGVRDAGGVVGSTAAGAATIEDCYNTGRVECSSENATFIAGGICQKGTVTGCYNVGEVVGGGAYALAPSAVDSFYLNTLTGVASGGATTLTAEQLQSWEGAYLLNGKTFVGGLDGAGPASTTWTAGGTANNGYPVFGNLTAKEAKAVLDPNLAAYSDTASVDAAFVIDGTDGLPAGLKCLATDLTGLTGVELQQPAEVQRNAIRWGTKYASRRIALEAGSLVLSADGNVGGVLSSDGAPRARLYAAGAYTYGATRTARVLAFVEGQGYVLSAEVAAVKEKKIDLTIPVEEAPSFEMVPDGTVHEGDKGALSTPSTITCNSSTPVVGSVVKVTPLEVGSTLSDGSRITKSLVPAAASASLLANNNDIGESGQVKLLVPAASGREGTTKLTADVYFNPSASTVPLNIFMQGNSTVAWHWRLDYTGSYRGDEARFGYAVEYEFSVPSNTQTECYLQERQITS